MKFEKRMDLVVSEFLEYSKTIRTDILSAEYISKLEIELESKTKIGHIASCSNKDSKTVLISLWDGSTKKVIKELESKNLGFNISGSENQIIVSSPPLSLERRNEIVDNLKTSLEEYKIKVRNIRRDIIKSNPELKKKAQSHTDESILKLHEVFRLKQDTIFGF